PLITLDCGQTTSRVLPADLVAVSLGDPRANGVAAWLKLAGKIVRITSSTDEVDHLPAKLRRIRWTCSWHRQHLWRETQGVHQTGSIPTLGFGTEALAPVKLGQIVQDPGNVGMVGAECHFRDRQGPFVKRLGLGVAALGAV